MRFSVTASFVLFCTLYSGAQLAVAPKPGQTQEKTAVADTIYDTVYVAPDDGIPWNRESFPKQRLLRHSTFDPALTVAYTYSATFASGTFGSFAHQSYLAHWDYEFTPDLHLFGAIGLWMPLYSNMHHEISREDVRQGNVQPIIPNIGLEYKFSNNSYLHVGISNEEDVLKAYGPIRRYYGPWRNSNFYP